MQDPGKRSLGLADRMVPETQVKGKKRKKLSEHLESAKHCTRGFNCIVLNLQIMSQGIFLF
jgi:hypothetical protein